MIYLATDHSGLNKFHGAEDQNFGLVLPEIQRMVQTEAQYRRMFLKACAISLNPF